MSGGLSLAAAVPLLLGCEPARSLVVITVAGGRVGVCGRVDLPADPVQAPVAGWLPAFGPMMQVNGVDSLVLVFCTGHPRRWRQAATRTADELGRLLPDPGRVRSLWRSTSAAGSYDEPADTTSLAQLCARDDLQALAFDTARRGRRPLSRSVLARQLDPAATGAGIPDHQLDDASAQMRRCPPADLEQTVTTLYRDMLAAAERGAALPEDRAADLLAAITVSPQARDRLTVLALRDAAGNRAASVVAGLTRLTGQAPDRVAPAIAWVLAVAAYRVGDGVLANLAVDRALRVDPTYPAAHLLIEFMCSGLHPQQLDVLLTAPA